MSTRRARIKAVAALPQRRKNVEKKQVEEVKDGFEGNLPRVKPARRVSSEKSPKKRRLSIDKEVFESGVSSRSPRGCHSSVDKTRRLSIDKVSKDEGGMQTRAQRLSFDKTPQSCLSIGKNNVEDGNRSWFVDNSPQYNKKTPQCRSSVDKTPKAHSKHTKLPLTETKIDKTLRHKFSLDVSKHGIVDSELQSMSNIDAKESAHFEQTKACQLSSDNPSQTPDRDSLIEISAKEIHTEKLVQKEALASDLVDKTKGKLEDCVQSSVVACKINEKDATKSISLAKNVEQPSTSKDNYNGGVDTGTTDAGPMFASPTPPTRPSIIVRTPVIEVDLIAEKMIAPHKGPQSETMQIIYKDKLQKKILETELAIPGPGRRQLNKSSSHILETALSGGSKKAKDQIKILNEYVIKPLPETSPIMDGIVPLIPARNVPKPIDLLKNEIISENAQVLFDPIVPLPSPTKARPKLRPAPRLAPRRNSIQQGSASESEDDGRRGLHGGAATPVLSRPRDSHTPVPAPARQRHDSHTPTPVRQRHDSQAMHSRQRHDSQPSQTHPIVQRDVARVRNDSVCSNLSQATSHITTVGSPMRERQRTHREEVARRNAALRKRTTHVDRNNLTMYDLIFYNPSTNPIIPDEDELKAKEANEKDKIAAVRKAEGAEESKDPAPAPASLAVPQIKLGPNGEIVLDEQSLVVNQFEQRKLEARVIREGAWAGSTTSSAYRRTPRTADWSDAETLRFYRALASLGTDFSMMVPLFPTRTRRDLKLKFKKEERTNLGQVDKALRAMAKFDPSGLEQEFTEERRLAEQAEERAREQLRQEKEEEKQRKQDMKNFKVKPSRCAKSLGKSAMPKFDTSGTTPASIEDYVKFQEERKKLKQPPKRKRASNVATRKNITVASPDVRPASPSLAALSLLERHNRKVPTTSTDTVRRGGAGLEVAASRLPPNLEPGSVVLMTVNDPQSPSTQVLHAFYAKGQGEFATVDPTLIGGLLNKSNSPQLPGSPRVGQVTHTHTHHPSTSRNRNSSYTITQL